jgi:RNA polymerase sigma-70 factor, ECF subfamily
MTVTTADKEALMPGQKTLLANALEMTTVITERLPYFRRMAMRRLDNAADAEDAVQDACLAAWKHLGQFRGKAQMATWLTAIVMNSSRTIMRKRGQMRLFSVDDRKEGENSVQLTEILPDVRPDPETQFRNSEYEWRLHHLSAQLPPTLRVVVRMRTIEGLSIRETADALGLTESAVKSRASRALATLRRLDQKTMRSVTGSAEPMDSHRRT